MAKEEEYIKSVFKALDVLEYLGKCKQEKGCLEIARELNLPSSTAYRLLSTLHVRGYVKQNLLTEAYTIGPKILNLQESASKILDIKKIAEPIMIKLAEMTRESCNLGILDGKEVVHIRRVESPEVIRANIRSFRLPAYTSAIGKVLLASISEDEASEIIPDKIPKMTDNSKTKEGLLSELKVIKNNGYGIDDEEGFSGVRSIAVPIYNHDSKVVAALSLVGPIERMTYEKINKLCDLLKTNAMHISSELGFNYDNF
ncbi:MAG: IclR family transcriptional regulator [Bacillota bacterium]